MSDTKRYLTVTALTKYIKRKFDYDPHLQDIWIRGEISNFKSHSRGHMYFTIKDENARIQAVMFSSQNRSIQFKPEDGMKVLIRGEVTVYEPAGGYQIYVKEMQPDGIGNLYLAYEELKNRLASEGLFDEKYKKSLPLYPETIGVITSPTGAAVRDILTTIKRRYPIGKVIIFPALVQGTNAAASIAKSISLANQMNNVDVLIVGRGGGSIEELWAFNEEIVAKTIFQSDIPIISAVGHETDFTIADFVADLRAPTPTAAAELAVPHIVELAERITVRQARLLRTMKEKITLQHDRLQSLQKSYAFRFPKNLYVQKEQQLDRIYDKFLVESYRNIKDKQELYKTLSLRLKYQHPEEKLLKANEQLLSVEKVLQKEIKNLLKHYNHTFQANVSKLNALSPLKIMERGYSLAYDQEGALLKSVNTIEAGDSVRVRLQDGQLDCQVLKVEERHINE
ncbi:exodeoxyribonuclease VII large subunit [Litchfieldia alkalitelluris]|uniref:exodeoxyribonuclease VII large subunit n=1 Tax=Litchfieldia alkalitelluris TaxID=304268 RepID=UPI00099622AC|nr:exodeoxyribonuclease VII large subunit [Litchfieldia alkalitelluris]